MEVEKARIATVSSPVFWGSFVGILFSALVAGLSYLQIIGASSKVIQPAENGWVVVFLCLLCIRYYASVVFLTYMDHLSSDIRRLGAQARRWVFWIQVLLIFGCSASASLLPVFGVSAACFIVILQGVMMMRYWRIVWSFVMSAQPQGDRHVIIFVGDIAILVSGIYYFLMEWGVVEYNSGQAGFCLGGIFMLFVTECATGYLRSIRAFVRETRNSLSDHVPGQTELGC